MTTRLKINDKTIRFELILYLCVLTDSLWHWCGYEGLVKPQRGEVFPLRPSSCLFSMMPWCMAAVQPTLPFTSNLQICPSPAVTEQTFHQGHGKGMQNVCARYKNGRWRMERIVLEAQTVDWCRFATKTLWRTETCTDILANSICCRGSHQK